MNIFAIHLGTLLQSFYTSAKHLGTLLQIIYVQIEQF
jgi:hypothetical protein